MIETVRQQYGNANTVAAFNTQGYIKHAVTYPLTPISDGALHGIYIRTTFRDYAFFPNLESPSNDIKQSPEAVDNVPALIRIANNASNGSGFNTSGSHKSSIRLPMTSKPGGLAKPWQGTYVRHDWPGFVFLTGVDSPGNNIRQVQGKQLHEIVQACRDDPAAVAFNTSGWLKKGLVDEPSDIPGADNLHGIYLKIPTDVITGSRFASDSVTLNNALFWLKGTALI